MMTGLLSRHPSARVLLLHADAELAPRAARHTAAHLVRCDACRAQAERLRRRLTVVDTEQRVRLRDHDVSDVARAELARRLRDAAHTRVARPTALSWAHAAALLLGLFVIGLNWPERVNVASYEAAIQSASTGLLQRPRPSLTPGAVRLASTAAVCADVAPPVAVPARVRLDVVSAYGASAVARDDYELDFLITPELGGTADARNLWPEPHHAEWNAWVKDELEVELRRLVCGGMLDMADAQREIATDWIAAYRSHFRTIHPRRDYVTNPPGEGDEALVRAERFELLATAGTAGPLPQILLSGLVLGGLDADWPAALFRDP